MVSANTRHVITRKL